MVDMWFSILLYHMIQSFLFILFRNQIYLVSNTLKELKTKMIANVNGLKFVMSNDNSHVGTIAI
jgi:hypothetical protein